MSVIGDIKKRRESGYVHYDDIDWLLSRVEGLVEESKRAREAIRVASLFIRDKDVEHALVQPIEANVTLGEYLHKAMAALDAELRKARE